MDRTLDVVLKVSKFCNLRCAYCYEFNELHLRNQMSLADLEAIFTHLLAYVRRRDFTDGMQTVLNFVWHGGEPFLVDLQFYRDALAIQSAVFRDTPLTNSFQTNLTILNPAILDFIRWFDIKLGVSIDLFGGLRKNAAGQEAQPRVLENMDRLRNGGVRFACITVLTAANLGKEAEIFDFFSRTGTSFRVLPLFEGAFEEQHATYDLSTPQILASLTEFARLWLQSSMTIEISPITEYYNIALLFIEHRKQLRFYDKRRWLPVLLVNTNGDCYGYGDPYGSPEYSYGNLIRDSVETLFTSAAFGWSVNEAKKRLAFNCTVCPYFGYCDGYPIAEGHGENRERNELGIHECHVAKGLFDYLVLAATADHVRDVAFSPTETSL